MEAERRRLRAEIDEMKALLHEGVEMLVANEAEVQRAFVEWAAKTDAAIWGWIAGAVAVEGYCKRKRERAAESTAYRCDGDAR